MLIANDLLSISLKIRETKIEQHMRLLSLVSVLNLLVCYSGMSRHATSCNADDYMNTSYPIYGGVERCLVPPLMFDYALLLLGQLIRSSQYIGSPPLELVELDT